ALYGKFLNAMALNPETSTEMFIDTTPGTPVIYREDVLKKLYTVGYDIENNLLFGLDSYADEYNLSWGRDWIARDRKILQGLALSGGQIEKYFSGNIKRFLGIERLPADRKLPLAGSN
ncbi:MAG: hypothetical protein PHV82_15470, partial [Victivallaceae bacterium]|nr:hypothetical protein [Victivallaceae bacterium]